MIYLYWLLAITIPIVGLFTVYMILTERWELEFDHLPDYKESDLPYSLREQAD